MKSPKSDLARVKTKRRSKKDPKKEFFQVIARRKLQDERKNDETEQKKQEERGLGKAIRVGTDRCVDGGGQKRNRAT